MRAGRDRQPCARPEPPSGPSLRRGRPGGGSAAPLPGALRAPKPLLSAGRIGGRAKRPPFQGPGRRPRGEGTDSGYLPGTSSADRSGILGSDPEIRGLGSVGQESRSAGRTRVAAALLAAGPLLISARGGGAGEVSAEGSRPPGRDADGSGPRGYPARWPACLPAPPEIWGGGGGGPRTEAREELPPGLASRAAPASLGRVSTPARARAFPGRLLVR